jgi:hypothetical protein
VNNLKFFLVALVTGAALSIQAFAQTVSTPIVGFQKSTVPVGSTALGFPLLNSDTIKTTATGISGSALTLNGETNVGSRLSSSEPYYIEVYSGSLKGDRFDVDTAATISAANSTVVLKASSANNTFTVTEIANQLNGETIALRQHITVEKIQSYSTSPLTGNNTASLADQLQVYDSGLGSYQSYYLRSNGTEWRLVGSPTVANKVVVPPGTGVFVRKATTAGELVSTGTVRDNDFARPYVSGNQLLANPYPISYSPSTLGATASAGWSGNNTAALADQIQIYNSGTGQFAGYYLRSNGTEWRLVGSPTVVTTSDIIADNAAYFVKRAAGDPNSVLLNPISP